jgi:hypothetical protein
MKSGLLLVAAVVVAMSVAARAQTPPTLVPLTPDGLVTYYIADAIPRFGSRPGDDELARWAFKEWERAAGRAIRLEASADEGMALIRLYWHSRNSRQFGQMKSHVGSYWRRQALLYVRPDSHSGHKTLGPAAAKDPLLRDTIVYMTCLHEIGHAFGLDHTDAADDVMRTEGSAENFQRYRMRLKTRADIAKVAWLSDADAARIRQLYKR